MNFIAVTKLQETLVAGLVALALIVGLLPVAALADIEGVPIETPGCTDPEAINYNPHAMVDDRSCEYEFVPMADLSILSPNSENNQLSGTEELLTRFIDDDITEDAINWTIRTGNCEAELSAVVAGNTNGFDGVYTYNEVEIVIPFDTTTVPNGEYCLTVDPQEQGEEPNLTDSVSFTIDNPNYVVTGTKYEDVDKNGAYSDEFDTVTVPGWTIIATEEGTGRTITTTTGADGTYQLMLPAGAWTITEGTRSGWEPVFAFSFERYIDLESLESEVAETLPQSCAFYFGSEMRTKFKASCNFLNKQVETSSGSTGTRVGDRARSSGRVLGAATTTGASATTTAPVKCEGMYLTSYLRAGQNNPADQVLKLQTFLKGLGYDVATSSVFDTATENAVRAFQEKYLLQVLTPWGIAKGTGYVYKTTRATINNMVCPGSEPTPQI